MPQVRAGVLLLSFALSCRTAPDRSKDVSQFGVQWTGSDRGRLSGPATAEWCASERRLEIRSIRGDTGVGLVLYPGETLAAGNYRVIDPVKAESLPPAAAVVLRWLTSTTVQGFQADSGTVDLKRSGTGLVSGGFRVRARSVVDTQKVWVNATFQDLSLTRGTGCAAPGDTGVH